VGAIRAESFDRTKVRSWSTIKTRIAEIERDCFGAGAFSTDELRRAFNAPRNLAVLLWDGRLLIGYTQAEPRRRGTYYIANTAIANSHQGRGLVKLLMDRLYADARAAGARFIERDVAIANGYADAVARAHAADIVESFDHDSEYGPQRFIRMRVPEP
jgi:ribosomal protein S18 acetylase RimI-like enzyme